MLDINNNSISNGVVFSEANKGIPLNEFVDCLQLYKEILSKESIKEAFCKMIDDDSDEINLKYEILAVE